MAVLWAVILIVILQMKKLRCQKLSDFPEITELGSGRARIQICLSFKKKIIYLAGPGLSCSMWDLVPWPGREPLHWEHGVLATGLPWKSPDLPFMWTQACGSELLWQTSCYVDVTIFNCLGTWDNNWRPSIGLLICSIEFLQWWFT